jgi:pimeloyl-ACP methyl ester carboxylesterase
MDNAASFLPLAQQLPGLDLVAIDFAGHGRSDHRPAGCHYHFQDYVFDLDAALDALGWHNCLLIGHSMGTGAAVSYACADPSRVSALLLLDGLGLMTEEAPLLPARMARALASVRNPRQHRSVFGAIEEAAAVRMANNPMHQGSAYLLAERALQRGTDGWHWRTDGRAMWTSPAYITEAQSSALMAAVQCPALALYTDTLEQYLGERLAGRLKALPDVQAHKVPGGHHVHMDQPDRLAPLINPFLATLDLHA